MKIRTIRAKTRMNFISQALPQNLCIDSLNYAFEGTYLMAKKITVKKYAIYRLTFIIKI